MALSGKVPWAALSSEIMDVSACHYLGWFYIEALAGCPFQRSVYLYNVQPGYFW